MATPTTLPGHVALPGIAEQARPAWRRQRRYERSSLALPVVFRGRVGSVRGLEAPATLTRWSPAGGEIHSAWPLRRGDWLELQLSGPSTSAARAAFGRPAMARVMGAPREDPANPTLYCYGLAVARGFSGWMRYAFERSIPALAVLLFAIVTIHVLYLKSFNLSYFWYGPMANLYSLTISFYILSRFAIGALYRTPSAPGFTPSVSVVVACKNEEASISRTLECIYASDYPQDRLQVVCINDGSTDGTLAEMERTRRRHPDLKIIDFPRNLGKRHGMAAGARAARGEVLVYIDSDSFVRPDTIRYLVQGFADPNVGAVCGHANVHNADQNMLTRMQQVRYYVAFCVVKAAESIFSTVACCSGCLAAYRSSYVLEILDDWLNQRFLGTQATFGDDRSLTNYMLRRFRVIYDRRAVCTTIVPETYRTFFKQQLRWKKSWVRETFIGARFMWRRHPLAAGSYYLGAVFPILSPVVAFNALVLPLFGHAQLSLLYVYGASLMALLYSLYYMGKHRDGLWIFGVVFCFFYMFVLVWQTYYALFTVRRNHWGTR